MSKSSKGAMTVVIPGATPDRAPAPRSSAPLISGLDSANPTKHEKLKLMALANTPLLSPGSAFSDFTGWARQVRLLTSEGNRAVDAQAVEQLVDAMKSALGALGGTFDAVGSQTARIAQMGPAMDVAHRVNAVRRELADQEIRQEERMQDLKQTLSEEIKSQLNDELKVQVDRIVRDIVRREIAQRVRRQLAAQIPDSLREEIKQTKHNILRARADLHNSEARRHNALIRPTALDEPLQPLLLPFPPEPADLWSFKPTSPSGKTPTTAATSPTQVNTPSPARSPTPTQKYRRASPPASERPPVFELPGTSKLFPRDVASLLKFAPDAIRELLRDYGLIGQEARGKDLPLSTVQGPQDSKVEVVGLAKQTQDSDSQEELLNRFMGHIGIAFRLVPASAGSSGGMCMVSL